MSLRDSSLKSSVDEMFDRDIENVQRDIEERNAKSAAGEVCAVEPVNNEEMDKGTATEGQQTVLLAADTFDYEGIKYSTIINELFQRLATDGVPQVGERNNVLYLLVRELRHICDYEFQKVYMLVAPYFRKLTDAEVRRTINSAISSSGRTITPTMKGVLSHLKQELQMDTPETDHRECVKAPLLPPVMEMVCAKYPKHLRNQVALCMLPILGTYGTHIRFRYLDNKVNSLSFMTAVVAPSTGGKSFAADLYNKLTKPLQVADAEQRAKAEEYREACESASEDGAKPKDPHVKVRLYGDDITTCMLLEYLQDLHGEHGLQFTEEVARLNTARRSAYGDNDDLYCKAFDNAIGGKESKSKMTRNIRIPIHLNTLFLGTPSAMHKFYRNPEGGLNNRVIFTTLPKVRRRGAPRYEDFTPEEEKLWNATCDMLWAAGTGDDNKEIKLPFLDKVIEKYDDRCFKEDDENPNEVWFDLRKRAMVIGYRAGVLAWILWGRPTDKKTLDYIKKYVIWVIDCARIGVYNFNGEDYERINEENKKAEARKAPKSYKLFSLLPTDFTSQQVQELRIQNGESTRVDMVLKQWLDSGMIRRTSHGCYTKLKNTAA